MKKPARKISRTTSPSRRSSPVPPAAELLRSLAAILRRRKLDWYVFGAQAVLARGIPRVTADVDVTVFVEDLKLGRLIDDLLASGFVARVGEPLRFAERNRVLPLFHASSGMLLDLVLGAEGLERSFLKRVEKIELGGGKVPMLSVEDIVLTKLIAGRPKDLEDVRSLLRSTKKVNRGYLDQQTTMLDELLDRGDLSALLDRLWREADR